MLTNRVALALGLTFLVTACYQTPKPECAFLCGTDGACPADYTCRPDNWCKRSDVQDTFVCDVRAVDAAVTIDGAAGGDASAVDASVADASVADASVADASVPDASVPDATPLPDSMLPDANVPDASPPDANVPDAEPPDANVPDAMPPDANVPTCSGYCTDYMANCSGLNEFGNSVASCTTYCETAAAIPLGSAADTDVDTVGCRTTHAGLAPGNTALHCPHASSTGGDQCGSYCDTYCRLVAKNCTGGDAITFTTDCMTDCGGYATNGVAGSLTGDTVQCRIHYAGSASAAPAIDCPKAAPTSTTCQ